MISIETLRQLAQKTGNLVYFGWGGGLRLCSRETLVVLGKVWEEAGFSVVPQEVGQQGVESIRIQIIDVDFSWARRLRQDFGPGIACQWHLVYRAGDQWESALQFSGELEAARIGRDGMVEIVASVAAGHTAWSPRVPFESPHSLPRGSEIVINGTTYRVE